MVASTDDRDRRWFWTPLPLSAATFKHAARPRVSAWAAKAAAARRAPQTDAPPEEQQPLRRPLTLSRPRLSAESKRPAPGRFLEPFAKQSRRQAATDDDFLLLPPPKDECWRTALEPTQQRSPCA